MAQRGRRIQARHTPSCRRGGPWVLTLASHSVTPRERAMAGRPLPAECMSREPQPVGRSRRPAGRARPRSPSPDRLGLSRLAAKCHGRDRSHGAHGSAAPALVTRTRGVCGVPSPNALAYFARSTCSRASSPCARGGGGGGAGGRRERLGRGGECERGCARAERRPSGLRVRGCVRAARTSQRSQNQGSSSAGGLLSPTHLL